MKIILNKWKNISFVLLNWQFDLALILKQYFLFIIIQISKFTNIDYLKFIELTTDEKFFCIKEEIKY